MYPDRIVVGWKTTAAEVMRQIYGPLTSGWYYGRTEAIPRRSGEDAARLIVTSTKSAELISTHQRVSGDEDSFIMRSRRSANRWRDVQQVCDGWGRIRASGRDFESRDWYGGRVSKDLMAFRAVAKENGYDFRLLESTPY